MTQSPLLGMAATLLSGIRSTTGETAEPTAKDVTVLGHKILSGSGPRRSRHSAAWNGRRRRALDADHQGGCAKPASHRAGSDRLRPIRQAAHFLFAGFVAGFLNAIAVPRGTFIGQSMGAAVALHLAVHHPEMVERLVLTNGGGFRNASDPPPPAPNWHDRQIANAGTLEESREYLQKLYYDKSLVTDKVVEHNLILRLRSAYTIESMQTANARGLGGLTEEEARTIKAPTLLVWGMNDPLSPLANADKLQAAIKNSRKVLIDKAGHFPFLEHPEKFNQIVLEFLQSRA
jgi:pimeloyl-ACP methyl ester carboxylesterase